MTMPSIAKVLFPLAVIVVLVVVIRRRRDFRENLGWNIPALLPLFLWLAASTAYMLGTDYWMNWRGPWNWEPWHHASPLSSACRVIGVVLLGPAAEELIFRGILQPRVTRRVGNYFGIVGTAALWAAIHLDYSLSIRAMIFGFGLILGAARSNTGSIWTPIVMHCAWNAYAIW